MASLLKEFLVAGRRSLAAFWAGLREVTEDSAYERYLAHHRSCHQGEPLTRAEFYRRRIEHKFSGKSGPNRCC